MRGMAASSPAADEQHARESDALKANLAANLERLRESRRLTKYALAKMPGLNKMLLGRIEAKKQLPGALALKRIAAALECSVDELLADPPQSAAAK